MTNVNMKENRLANNNKAEIIAKAFIARLSSSSSPNGKLNYQHLSSLRHFRKTLHDVCSSKEKAKNFRSILFRRALKDDEIIVALFSFTLIETEDSLVRRYSTLFVRNFIERHQNFVQPLVNEMLLNMKLLGRRASMEAALQCCVRIFADKSIAPGLHYYRLTMNLIAVYCYSIADLYINELGAGLLLSIIKSLSKRLLPYLREITFSLRLALLLGYRLMQRNFKNCQSFVINVLTCVRFIGLYAQKSELTVQLYRNSGMEIVQLLRYVAAFGKLTDYVELVDIFVMMFTHEKMLESHLNVVLMGCIMIVDTLNFAPKVRIKTLEAIGQAIAKRSELWSSYDFCSHTIFILMRALFKTPEYDLEAVHALEFDYMPSPVSVAADLLHFIAIKIKNELVGPIVMGMLFRTIDCAECTQWERRGAFLSLGRVVKGCGEYLNAVHSSKLALLFKYGLVNESLFVRDAAIYALHKLFVYLGTKTFFWSKSVFPAMLQNLELFIDDTMCCMFHHPWHVERMLAIMQLYCCFFGREISKYLPTLMNIVYSFLCDVRERRIVLSTLKILKKIVSLVGGEFIPYLSSLFSMLSFYITYWDISFNNEIRPNIVDLFAKLLCSNRDILKYDGPKIILLVYNMLQQQQLRINCADNYIVKLFEYSDLRYTIFNFFKKLSNVMREEMAIHLPKILGTLFGTISGADRFEYEYNSEFKTFYYKPEDVNDLAIESTDANCFRISCGNEIEIGKLPYYWNSPMLIEEVLQAAVALSAIVKNCILSIGQYLTPIFDILSQTLTSTYVELRKHAAIIMNTILKSIQDGVQSVNYLLLSGYLVRLSGVLPKETNLDVWILNIESLLYGLAIEEKFFAPGECKHAFLVDGLNEIFELYGTLEESAEYITTKSEIFNNIIDFMPKLSTACINSSFSNYFGVFLYLFEIRLKQISSNQERIEIYERLNEYFLLMDGNNVHYFKRIEALFIKALNDTSNIVREYAVSGLVSLIEHYPPQCIDVYKRIIKILLKTSKRENADKVLDNTVYALSIIIRRNLWQLPMYTLWPKILRLLPIRTVFSFNIVIVELIELIYREMPAVIATHVNGTFNILVMQIDNTDDNDDLNPLQKKALTLASNIYAKHYKSLHNVEMCCDSMQAIITNAKMRI